MFSLLLAVIYLAFISLGLPDSLLGSVWPTIYQEFNVPVSYAGAIFMIISAGTIFSSLQSDRLTLLGTGKVTAFSVLMTAVALWGFSISSSYWMLVLWAIPYGLGAGSVDASLNNYVALNYKSHHMSWLHCMWGVGASIGPYIMSFALLNGQTWNMGYRYISLIQVVLTIIIMLSLPLWKKRPVIDDVDGVQESENKKDKATLKAEKRAAIKAARDAAKKAAGKEVRVLSTEEKIYNSAVSVMEAADCVERFERVYISMNNAAAKFGKIPGYLDSDERRAKCLEIADKAVKNGTAEVFDLSCQRQKKSKTKSDFVDAIENFERCKKFKYKVEECDRHIEECQKGILKLETKAAYKRRGIVLAVFAALIVFLLQTPVYPMCKGIYHQSQKKYKLAIANYKEANGFLVANGNMKKCYYYIGLKKEKKGKDKSALINFKKAEKKFDAQERAAKLEKKFIQAANVGDVVIFGTANWVILEKTSDGKVLMMKEKAGKKKRFSMEETESNDWYESKARRWLNTKQLKKYSDNELGLVVVQNYVKSADDSEFPEYFFELSKDDFEKYKNVIPQADTTYWLKEAGEKSNEILCVQPDGNIKGEDVSNSEIALRQACWLNINKSAETVPTATPAG